MRKSQRENRKLKLERRKKKEKCIHFVKEIGKIKPR